MKNLLFVVILSIINLICVPVSQAQQQPAPKLSVTILYESLCPDSIKFIARQLQPNYDALKDYIDVQFVPFGKSQSVNNGEQFTCQHGPAECEGNRLQSCVLHQTTDQAAQVNFVSCQMTSPDSSSIKYCAEASGLSSDITNCMNTLVGTQLQLRAEQITNLYEPSFVPTIVYDGVFNQRLQNSSLRNFRGTVCALLQQRGAISFNSDPCV